MRTNKDIYETMQLLQPYLQKIAKDIDADMSIQISLIPSGEGWAILCERNKDVEYAHYVTLAKDCIAVDVQVEHRFIDGMENQYHQDIENHYQTVVA